MSGASESGKFLKPRETRFMDCTVGELPAPPGSAAAAQAGGSKSVLQHLDTTVFDCRDVESHDRGARRGLREEQGGEAAKPAALRRCYRLEGGSEPVAGPRLDLADDEDQ